MDMIVDITAQMRPAFDDQHGASRIDQQPGNDRARKSGTNNQTIGARYHFESVVSKTFLGC